MTRECLEAAMSSGLVERTLERLETPPSAAEGEIETVDFRPDPSHQEATTRPCQHCRQELDVEADDVVEATVRIDDPQRTVGSARSRYYPQFCSRECWAAWASCGR